MVSRQTGLDMTRPHRGESFRRFQMVPVKRLTLTRPEVVKKLIPLFTSPQSLEPALSSLMRLRPETLSKAPHDGGDMVFERGSRVAEELFGSLSKTGRVSTPRIIHGVPPSYLHWP